MSPASQDWGPRHETKTRRAGAWFRWPMWGILLYGGATGQSAAVILASAAAWFVVGCVIVGVKDARAGAAPGAQLDLSADPIGTVQAEVLRAGGGVVVGASKQHGWRASGRERALLVLGPPRSGKSSAVMVPAVLGHAGPVVSTSTKNDVLTDTAWARASLGDVWHFDPTGNGDGAAGGRVLQWSPVSGARSWDGALVMARAMTSGARVGHGAQDSTHWAKRATALLAADLHAAALYDLGIDVVVDWVVRHELAEPQMLLQRREAQLAAGLLEGLINTEARERSSICSAAADAVDAYSSDGVLAAARNPNFDAEAFVASQDTVYVTASGEEQALAAPLVCGLLSDIRRATYRAHAAGHLPSSVLLALDEVANIAPIPELPAIASEGGGQGLLLVAAFQDLSQARVRWGEAADGFLTLFGAKLLLPGVADPKTLEAVSVALGEYDRQVVSRSTHPSRDSWLPQHGRTVSTQRTRILSPGEVANIPAGHGLWLSGLEWELVKMLPAYRCEPWHTLSRLPLSQDAGR